MSISNTTLSELDKAKSDLHQAETLQKRMKDANAIIRSKKNVTERLVKDAGLSESQALKIQSPDYAGRIGFATYSLTNNNASIKRLQDRVNMLEKKVKGAEAVAESGSEERYIFDGGEVFVNYPIDRVQILFPGGRTEKEIYSNLRHNGWVYSPSNKAFQRKITPQAISNAVRMFKAVKVEGEGVPEEIAEPEMIEETIEVQAPIKKLVRLNRYYNGLAEGTIGEITGAPNMFVKYVKFGDKVLTIDNGYLSKVDEVKELRFPKLPLDHPLNILDEKSGQYKQALEEERAKISEEAKEPIKVESIEILEPNTPDEFDEAIISKIDAHDNWIGNVIKERAIKKQIFDQIDLAGSGTEEERKDTVERIFEKYKERELAKVIKPTLPVPESFVKGLDDLAKEMEAKVESVFKGIHHDYKNQYELNKAIEALLTQKGTEHNSYTSEEKNWIRKYSGYGGLDKYGATGKGGLFEYYTPRDVIEKMWALAYKYGYNNGSVLEPSVATGEFLQFAKSELRMVGYEINEFSAMICRILYPTAKIHLQPFEQLFIKNNWTMKDNVESLEKFDLVIGNPPYGDFSVVASRYMTGMGEKDYTQARNYVEYFIRRGLDLLKPKGLLIYIVGAQLKNGGNMFLDSGNTPVKEYLAKNCTLLDAYRLPDSVFERTGVTSDIIVLQKI